LSYLDHKQKQKNKQKNKQKDKQKDILTRVKQYLSPKHSLGRGNKTVFELAARVVLGI